MVCISRPQAACPREEILKNGNMRYRQHLLYCRTVRYGAPKITITQMVCSVPFHRKPTKMEGSALEKKTKVRRIIRSRRKLIHENARSEIALYVLRWGKLNVESAYLVRSVLRFS